MPDQNWVSVSSILELNLDQLVALVGFRFSSSTSAVETKIYLNLEATNAVPNEAALATINTNPMTAQLTYGSWNTGKAPMLNRYRPELAINIPAMIRAIILSTLVWAWKKNKTLQAKNNWFKTS
jgi:hypothetical protein